MSPRHASVLETALRRLIAALAAIAIMAFAPGALAWVPDGYLSVPPTPPGLGYSVAMSGSTLVVGAPSSGAGAGVVFVYVLAGGTWSLQQELQPDPSVSGFGGPVAIDGDTLLVGAPDSDVVYAFTRTSGNWSGGPITIPGTVSGTRLGAEVAISGTEAAVTAPGPPGLGGNNGNLYTLTQQGGQFTLDATISIPGTGVDTGVGTICLTSSYLAMFFMVNGGYGSVTIYTRANHWGSSTVLPNPPGGRGQGAQIAMSDNGLFLGIGPVEVANGVFNPGTVYWYTNDSGAWSIKQTIVASDGQGFDGFGSDVAASGDYLAVGTSGSSGRQTQGAVYVFQLVGGAWSQTGELLVPATSYNETQMTISAATLAVALYPSGGPITTDSIALFVPSGSASAPALGVWWCLALAAFLVLAGCLVRWPPARRQATPSLGR
jgi:hypothetical protein